VRRRRIVKALAAGAAVAAAAALRTTSGARHRPGVLRGTPLLIAHRGGAALAPENTMPAFRDVLDTWHADMIELDVRASADGHCVVIHDGTVDRTTDGHGAVAAMTLAELRELDAGHRFTCDGSSHPFRGRGIGIPCIEEVLESLPKARITIEVKAGAAQAPLFDALDRFNAFDRVVLGGMHDRDRTLFRRRHRGATSPSLEQLRPWALLQRVGAGALWRLPGDVVQVPENFGDRRVVTPGFVRAIHRQGLDVHVWTVNRRVDMERLLDWGVDGLVTDWPDVLGTLLHERIGRPLAPGHTRA
jgi:glycerophosphoryl diester phosphodiesterase